jgi:hypothetical protein
LSLDLSVDLSIDFSVAMHHHVDHMTIQSTFPRRSVNRRGKMDSLRLPCFSRHQAETAFRIDAKPVWEKFRIILLGLRPPGLPASRGSGCLPDHL